MFLEDQLGTLVFGVELGTVLNNGILLVYAGLLMAAAVSDLRRFVIPNALVVALLALWPFWTALHGTNGLGYTLLGALGVFALGAVAFSFRLMGGGDVKLLTVLALWAGIDGLIVLILIISVAGGLLSVFWVSNRRLMLAGMFRWADGFRDNSKIPYGVAIAIGGLSVARRLWVG